MINKKKYFLVAIVLIILIVLTTAFYFKYKKGDVNSDVSFLKVTLVEGRTTVNNINIENNGDDRISFLVIIKGIDELKNFVSIDEDNFELDHGKEKDLKVFFNSKGMKPGIYIGSLELFFNEEIKQIPIILEVQSKEILFDSNINLFSKDNFSPGGKLIAEINIFDLVNLGRTNVKLIYFIKDFDGRTIVSESENLVVDSKVDYSKSLNLPEDMKIGSYVLAIAIEYEDSIGTSSSFFEVSKKNLISLDNAIFLAIFLFGLFFMLFLGIFIYSLFYKDKLLKVLYNQYKLELEKEKEIMKRKSVLDYKKLKNKDEKNVYKKQIRKVQKERIKAIKEIYKKRLKRYKGIKKKGDKAILMKQLKQWKTKGYDTRVLENKFKIPNVNEIRKQLKQWKTKGYDTRVLDKKNDSYNKI